MRNAILVTVKLPRIYIDIIDELVNEGRYSSRSEFIRTAVRKLIQEEMNTTRLAMALSKEKNTKNVKIIRV